MAIVSLDLHVSDTYFVVGHFHYVMAVAGTFSIFGGVYYLYPKFTGRMYHETLCKLGFWLSFGGVNTIFFPMMVVGVVEGMPRRYWDYAQFPNAEPYQYVMSIGAIFIAVGFLCILASWFWGFFKGEAAGDNPWGSRSLEWTTTSPPLGHGNWEEVPSVADGWGPYEYGTEKA